ncbi:MAG: tubulin-like doman-containing protein [Nitrospirae bacterium]|nr:tubulin-like doman-containing protein [Nitrospirota bacterium]
MFSQSVIVGIGGVGKSVLLNVRRMIVEEFDSLDLLPSIGFLHVDTHTNLVPDAGSNAVTEYLGNNLTFSAAERVELSGGIAKADAESIRRKTNGWLDPKLNLNVSSIPEGAGGIRPFGRLAFTYNVIPFRESLSGKIRKVMQLENITTTSQTLKQPTDNNLYIYIVCSFMGGTGSGSFIELCYNTRKVLKSENVEAISKVIGVFIIGGDNPTKRANCYSALKELQHYTMPNTTFNAEYPDPNAMKIINDKTSPVDVCYIVTQNAGDYQLIRGELEEVAAFNLFLEFSSDISNTKKGLRVDKMSQPGFINLEPQTNKPRSFLSFGLSSLSFPVFKIEEMMAYEMASATLQRWLFMDAITPVDSDILNQIDRKNLFQVLLNPEKKNIINEVNFGIEKKKAETITQKDANKIGNISMHFDEYKRDLQFSADPRLWGALTRAVQMTGTHQLLGTVNKLKEVTLKTVEDQYKGHLMANAFLNGIASYIDKEVTNLQKMHKSFQDEMTSMQNKFSASVSVLRETIGKDKFAVLHWINKVYGCIKGYAEAALYAEAYRVIIDMLSGKGLLLDDGSTLPSVRDELETLRRSISRYKESISSLSDRFSIKKQDIEGVVLAHKSFNDLMLNRTSLYEVIRSIVADPSVYAVPIMNDLIYHFAKKDNSGKTISEIRILNIVDLQQEGFINALLNKCKERCSGIRRFSIASILQRSPSNGIANILYSYVRRSKPMITIADPDVGEGLLHEWLGTSNPEGDTNIQALVKTIYSIKNYAQGGNLSHMSRLSDMYRIIFASEYLAFPLHKINLLGEYRQSYLAVNPSSTDVSIDFPDIFPDNWSDVIKRQAESYVLLGRIFDFLIQRTDAESGYDHIYLTYHDERSRQKIYTKLSRNWTDVEQHLITIQAGKDIDNLTASETPLEILTRLVDKIAASLKTRKDREALWSRLEGYLDKLKDSLDDREANPEFNRQLVIIEDYRRKFNLEPPESPHEIIRLDLHGDADKPDDTAVSSFRNDLTLLISRGIRDKDALINRGINRHRLSIDDAERLVLEALSTTGNGGKKELYRQYKEAFKSCYDLFGEVIEDDRIFLKDKQKKLGLTDDEVLSIEQEVKNEQ